MVIRKDKIIVVDLEATCWEGYDAPPGQENEIIEVGVCLVAPKNDSISVTNKRSILIKPTQSTISPFCTELTGITPSMVAEEGVDFSTACAILEDEYDSRNRLWASWGSFDRNLFWQQCKRRDVRYPFSKKHSNLKRVFQDCLGQRMGLARAMQTVGIEAVGTAHRGDDDAYNTGILLKYLLEFYGMQIIQRYGF